MRAAIFFVVTLVFAGACGNSATTPKDAPIIHDGGTDSNLDASCFTNPTTHYEIINACTGAQQVFKPGQPPLLGSDGSLPPLP
jgi:hypothetical protein